MHRAGRGPAARCWACLDIVVFHFSKVLILYEQPTLGLPQEMGEMQQVEGGGIEPEFLIFAYFGITGNFERLAKLYEQVRRCWRKWLARRSSNSPVSGVAYQRVLARFPLPRPKIIHRYAGP